MKSADIVEGGLYEAAAWGRKVTARVLRARVLSKPRNCWVCRDEATGRIFRVWKTARFLKKLSVPPGGEACGHWLPGYEVRCSAPASYSADVPGTGRVPLCESHAAEVKAVQAGGPLKVKLAKLRKAGKKSATAV